MNLRTYSLWKLGWLFFCIGCLAWGEATNSADVTVSVTDPSGAVVPGVTVTVRDIDKNLEKP
jgi:hypothetical protein